ncbi:MAG TPA: hypothetical protein VN745_08480 [Verrucomicrobiae bacterium]|nr:hypothetical protein [Verrucomicrobiae bacterium]
MSGTGFSKKLDVAANIATIVLVLAVAVLISRDKLTSIRGRSAPHPDAIHVGSALENTPLKSDWSSSQETLVLGLQTTCHFCTDSAPFLRHLIRSIPKEVRTVAVLPQSHESAKHYLDGLGIHVDSTKRASLAAVGITGTPTLLLVNNLGIVKNVWVGELDSNGQKSVLSELQGTQGAAEAPNTRRVRLNSKRPDDPARIVLVKEGDVDVTPGVRPYKSWEGKPFQADDDWVKNLTVTIKNLSNKEIVAASLNVYFPETGTGRGDSPVYGDVISLGRRPAMYARAGGTNSEKLQPEGTSAPLQILPGQQLTVSLAQYYPEIQQSVEQSRPMSNLTVCSIVLEGVFFSDGMMWAQGHEFKKPDPTSPGRYVDITADQFWGRTSSKSN